MQKKETVAAASKVTADNSIISDNASKSRRARNFAKLVYPTKEQYEAWYKDHPCDPETGEATPHYDGDSGYGETPDNWIEILDSYHVAAIISPLHGLDINPDGSLKKPHYHVMLMFEGMKSQDQADEIFDAICGVGRETIQSARGYARYMQHLDNPEKHRYTETPRCLGGIDYDAIIHLPGDDTANIKDMLRYIRVNNIRSFARFVDICSSNNDEWFNSIVHRNAYIIKEYIKSLDWEQQHDDQGGI